VQDEKGEDKLQTIP